MRRDTKKKAEGKEEQSDKHAEQHGKKKKKTNKQTELSAATHNMTAATTMAIVASRSRTRTWCPPNLATE